jgi:hypothetical protein
LFTSAWPLLGRHAKHEAIDELLAAARGGLSAALMLTSEPGIGKKRRTSPGSTRRTCP